MERSSPSLAEQLDIHDEHLIEIAVRFEL